MYIAGNMVDFPLVLAGFPCIVQHLFYAFAGAPYRIIGKVDMVGQVFLYNGKKLFYAMIVFLGLSEKISYVHTYKLSANRLELSCLAFAKLIK